MRSILLTEILETTIKNAERAGRKFKPDWRDDLGSLCEELDGLQNQGKSAVIGAISARLTAWELSSNA